MTKHYLTPEMLSPIVVYGAKNLYSWWTAGSIPKSIYSAIESGWFNLIPSICGLKILSAVCNHGSSRLEYCLKIILSLILIWKQWSWQDNKCIFPCSQPLTSKCFTSLPTFRFLYVCPYQSKLKERIGELVKGISGYELVKIFLKDYIMLAWTHSRNIWKMGLRNLVYTP